MKFSQFNLDARLTAGIQRAGYTVPTPIQEQAIPVAMHGDDIIGTAQTGTGKTAAFVLPILHKLMKGPRGTTRALIITPTRELAEQIHDMIRVLAYGTGLRSVTEASNTKTGVLAVNHRSAKIGLKRGVELESWYVPPNQMTLLIATTRLAYQFMYSPSATGNTIIGWIYDITS